jgi:hypothetical protein
MYLCTYLIYDIKTDIMYQNLYINFKYNHGRLPCFFCHTYRDIKHILSGTKFTTHLKTRYVVYYIKFQLIISKY